MKCGNGNKAYALLMLTDAEKFLDAAQEAFLLAHGWTEVPVVSTPGVGNQAGRVSSHKWVKGKLSGKKMVVDQSWAVQIVRFEIEGK